MEWAQFEAELEVVHGVLPGWTPEFNTGDLVQRHCTSVVEKKTTFEIFGDAPNIKG